MSGPKIVEIPKEFRSARGTLSLELAEKLNVTGEEKYVEEVMKPRGRDIKDGAVAIVKLVGNGQFVTRGGNLGSTIPLSQLVKGADAGVTLKLNVELEKLIWTAEGPGMRIIGGWLDSLEVAGDMTIVEEGEVRGVDTIKFLPERPYDWGLQDGAVVHVNHPSGGSRGQGKDREGGSGDPRDLGRA